MGKIAPLIRGTKVGQAINIGTGVLTASELARVAGSLYDENEIDEKFF